MPTQQQANEVDPGPAGSAAASAHPDYDDDDYLSMSRYSQDIIASMEDMDDEALPFGFVSPHHQHEPQQQRLFQGRSSDLVWTRPGSISARTVSDVSASSNTSVSPPSFFPDAEPPSIFDIRLSSSMESVPSIHRARMIPDEPDSPVESPVTPRRTTITPDRGFSLDRLIVGRKTHNMALHVGRTVRSVARLTALFGSHYDTTDHVLQDLTLLEQWTDDADELRQQVAASDGTAVVLNLLKVFRKEPTVLVKVCNIITYMARNVHCCAAIAAQGAIPAIVRAMKQHPTQALLQARACNALNNLAMREDNRVRIAQARGITRIVHAMKLHPTNSELQANGSNCLWNLAILPQNRPLVAEAGGVQVILQAMTDHVTDPSLFGEGCGCLWNLADYGPAGSLILSSGGIDLIFHAMGLHQRQQVMHRLCLGAIESLVNDNDVGRVFLWKRCNSLALVFQSMRDFLDDEEIQSAGCGILASLACGDLMNLDTVAAKPFVSTLHQRGAIPLIFAAMERHGHCTKVQCRGCSAIMYLAMDEHVRQALLHTPRAIKIVKTALFAHTADRSVFGTALMALSQLTTSIQQSRSEQRATAA